jgi:hypothetical protein
MPNLNKISAEITGVKYTPYLCRKLRIFESKDFVKALSEEATFILRINQQQIAVSWWVSAKRTRTYPYARVYDSLAFSGKKVTIVPIFKDEGSDGERDFLQYDTVSLMSLLGVYVIISYYADAKVNPKYPNKITRQRFDTEQIMGEIKKILSYQSDALHWNLAQLDKASEIGEKAIEAYSRISTALGVNMHSIELSRKRINELEEGKDAFLKLSRNLAEKAQKRESITKQPKEKREGIKATITIKNYLGGEYYLTSDETEIHENEIFLIEGKYTNRNRVPAISDIKDALLRMILLTNLQNVRIGNKRFTSVPILKLTTVGPTKFDSLSPKERKNLDLLTKEAETNGFRVLFNSSLLKSKG